jgi:Cu(I)/Ag(I) efflux system membrane fusion protein
MNKDNIRERLKSKGYLWVILAAVALGTVTGYAMRGDRPGRKPSATHQTVAAEPGDSTVYASLNPEQVQSRVDVVYGCPMNCVRPMEKPGKCPICGMDLVALSPQEHGHDGGAPRLHVSAETARAAGIQVAPVERKFASAEVRLYGQIDYDPAHMSYITAFMPGVVDRVYVKRAGQFLRWGDPLFDISSSDLLATQQQLIKALKHVPGFFSFQKGTPFVAREAPVSTRKGLEDTGKKSPEVEEALKTIDAIRHKLHILGLVKRDIDEFMKRGEATGIATVYSPMYGQVIEHKAFEGAFVNTGTPLFAIGDPRFVWARLDAYEKDYPWIRRRQEVYFETDAYPGETFKGEIVYIDPVFNTKTRTFNIGVIASDQSGRLKAGLLVRAVIHARLTADGKVVNEGDKVEQAPLVIPASAPLITGKRAVVYVAVPGEEGLFEGREVVLGPNAQDYYVVLAGLNEGERVVVNGNFKIDSAIQILAKPSMMSIKGGHSATEHQSPGGSEVMDERYRRERNRSRLSGMRESKHPDNETSMRRERPAGHLRADKRVLGSSIIKRRKPGVYGDTMRKRPLPPGQ